MVDPKTDEVRDDQESPEPETVNAEVLDNEPGANAEDGTAQQAAEDATDAEAEEVAGAAESEQTAEDAVAQAQAKAAEWQDKYLRLHAEWDTYRRRMNEQREEEKKQAAEKLVEGLIPVMDDFERTIDYANNNGEAGLLSGVEAVHNKLSDVLSREGVVIIDPAGQAYNALEAQAVGTVDDASVPDETVAQVYQKGYRMGAKVIRPAMVTITTGGPKREAEEDEEE